ncbi:MAG: radical SAM protein [Clostridia bacterium]|nr:radical SAM protein [Clostridia bacterium]
MGAGKILYGKQAKPFVLQWHITHKCNLHCAHCYQQEYSSHAGLPELIEVLDKYERFLFLHGFKPHIFLTGGEPFSSENLFPLLEEIKKRGMPFTLLTNGTLIDIHKANRLAFLQPECVQVSLDGTREIHDGIRGQGSFDMALRGIDSLVSQGVKVIVSFTVQKTNQDCFSELADICRRHGVFKIWWDRVVTDTPESTESLALSTEEFHRFLKRAAKLHDKFVKRNKGFYVSCERSLQFTECKRPTQCYTCHAGKDMVTVLADGSVMPCRRLPFVVGNIFTDELEDILSSSDTVKELRNAPIPEECLGCEHSEICRGGAKCVTYGQTGRLFAKDVNCFIK